MTLKGAKSKISDACIKKVKQIINTKDSEICSAAASGSLQAY